MVKCNTTQNLRVQTAFIFLLFEISKIESNVAVSDISVTCAFIRVIKTNLGGGEAGKGHYAKFDNIYSSITLASLTQSASLAFCSIKLLWWFGARDILLFSGEWRAKVSASINHSSMWGETLQIINLIYFTLLQSKPFKIYWLSGVI